MIGNFVIIGKGTDFERISQIEEVYFNAVRLKGCESMSYVTSIEPIHLCENLLVKNGFKKELLCSGNESFDDWVEYNKFVDNHYLSIRHCSNSIGRDWFIHIDNDYHCSVGGMDIEYVHQLQNACRLFGIELDLNL